MTIPHWEHIDVTSSRRPVLVPSEEILYVQSHVGLYNGKYKVSDHQDGVVYLTNHRICYVDSAQPALRSIALELQKVDRIDHSAGFLKSSPKVSIRYPDPNSSNTTSGRSTPLDAALVPPKQKITSDWVCTFCTYTNQVPQGHLDRAALPPCVNCGMKPGRNIKLSQHVQPPQENISAVDRKTKSSFTGRDSGLLPQIQLQSDPRDRLAAFICPRCTFANHPAITTCELCGAPLISRNLPPVLRSNANTDERESGSNSPIPSSMIQEMPGCKISFRDGGDKSFLEKMRKAVVERAWSQQLDKVMADSTMKEDKPGFLKGAGISALQIREESLRSKDADTMSDAFEDLEGLMRRAKEMVALAELFAKRVTAAPLSAGTSDARQLILESSAMLGLSSQAVTKDFVGKSGDYHAELARQIVDFLEDGKLKQEGGVITLVDLYALYNRARKGNLIAPDDLHKACLQFERLRLPVILRSFKSGINVVQDRGRDDASIKRLILTWLNQRTLGITAVDAAERFGWSVGVAREELEMVEQSGELVRDTGVEGLRFYANEITSWDWQPWLDTSLST